MVGCSAPTKPQSQPNKGNFGRTAIAVDGGSADIKISTMAGSYDSPTELVRAYLEKSGEYTKKGSACKISGNLGPLSNHFKNAFFVENGNGLVLSFGTLGDCYFRNHGSSGAYLGWEKIRKTVKLNFPKVRSVYFQFQGKQSQYSSLPYASSDDWGFNG